MPAPTLACLTLRGSRISTSVHCPGYNYGRTVAEQQEQTARKLASHVAISMISKAMCLLSIDQSIVDILSNLGAPTEFALPACLLALIITCKLLTMQLTNVCTIDDLRLTFILL